MRGTRITVTWIGPTGGGNDPVKKSEHPPKTGAHETGVVHPTKVGFKPYQGGGSKPYQMWVI